MKNDELLDMLNDFKPDDKFIEEALNTDFADVSIARVGKARLSPMRIIAPIAACLAVAVGVKIAVTLKGMPQNINENASSSANITRSQTGASQTACSVKTEDVSVDYADIEFISEDEEEQCKQILAEKYGVSYDRLKDAVFTRKTLNLDDKGIPELILHPYNVGELKGMYVFNVFGDTPRLIGVLDPEGDRYRNTSEISGELDICQYSMGKGSFFYYETASVDSRELDGESVEVGEFAINKIVVNEDGTLGTVKLIADGAEFVGENSLETRRFLRVNGEDVSADTYQRELNKYDLKDCFLSCDDIVDFDEIKPFVEVLSDKYGVSVGTLENSVCHLKTIDINGDNRKEYIVCFSRVVSDKLKGMYVFAKDGGVPRFIGELDPNGERGGSTWRDRSINIRTYKYKIDGKSLYYYHSAAITERHDLPGWACTMEYSVNKIVVNADGTLSTEKLCSCGARFIDNNSYETEDFYCVNGKEVSEKEYYLESRKYAE